MLHPDVNHRFRRAPLLSRAFPGFVVVCSVDGRCTQLSGSAVHVWHALPESDEPPVEFGHLIERLTADHGIAATVAQRDASSVLRTLEAIGCAVHTS